MNHMCRLQAGALSLFACAASAAAPASAQTNAASVILQANPFRLGQVPADGASTQGRSLMNDIEWAGARIELAGSRTKSRRPSEGTSTVARERVSSWQAAGRLSFDASARDSLGLVGSVQIERRRPVGLVSTGKAFSSQAGAVGLDWIHRDRLRLSAMWFESAPRHIRSLPNRVSELGGGGLPDAHGLRLAAELMGAALPSGRGMSLGFETRLQRLRAADPTAQGRDASGRDVRAAIALSIRF